MLRFKYQIIFLGDIECQAYHNIRERFFEKIQSIGLTDDSFDVISRENFDTQYLNQQPSFCYYFGKVGHNNLDIKYLNVLKNNGDAIFPLFFGNDFNLEIPEVIHEINGKRYDETLIDDYVNRAFECLKLLRENRGLFISYKRADSSAVAHQLFEAFVKRNYDVFLDSYSIDAASNFQEELHHRLTDCDVLVQLYSEEFKKSRWCNEEIVSANQKQVGVVEIVWPHCEPDIHNHLCEPVMLNEDSFVDFSVPKETMLLMDNVVSQITRIVESVRIRNMAARQDNLIGEFVDEAKKQGRTLIKEYEYLIESSDNGPFRIFIPAIGVPQSYDCYNSLRFRKLLKSSDIQIFLIYDDLSIQKLWIDHLDWLNIFLEVKTIKKQDFSQWLKNN